MGRLAGIRPERVRASVGLRPGLKGATLTIVKDRLRHKARSAFCWKHLRPGQLEAMASVMAGRDTLLVMPTGSGKSAVYQVPALLLDGPTVVVSPLIVLQRDEVAALTARESAGAAGGTGSPGR